MIKQKRLFSLLLALLMLVYIPAAALASSIGNFFPGGGIFVPINPPDSPGSNSGSSGSSSDGSSSDSSSSENSGGSSSGSSSTENSTENSGGSSGGSGHQHDYKWTTIIQATCTQTGSQRGTCRNCGDTTTRTIGKARHSFEWTVLVQVTCKTDGEERGVCRNCGYTRTDPIKKGPHNYGEWVVTREPSDGVLGERIRTCQTCGKAETETFYGADTLYPGIQNREEAVMQLQQALTDAGYLKSKIDGDYGKITTSAVRRFQKDNGLTADGIAWPSMQGLLLLNRAEPASDGIGAGSEEAIVSVRFELISTLPASLAPGESAQVAYRVTNDGTAVLKTSWFGIDCGSQRVQKDYGKLTGGDRFWFLPGDSFIFEQQINVSDQDIANGSIKRTLLVGGEIWCSKATDEIIVMSNQAEMNNYASRKLKGAWSVSDGYEIPLASKAHVHEVTAESNVVSVPGIMPDFYVPGEDIYYDIVVTNLSETALLGVEVESSLLPGTSVITADRIEAGETFTFGPYSYQATFDDAVGPLVNHAQVSFTYEDTQTSDTVAAAPVEVWIGLNDGSLDISKSIANAPANGSFFTIGEIIDFAITVVNSTNLEMHDVIVTDQLTSGSGYAETILFEASDWPKDASQTLTYFHTVTAADVALGSVTNSALIHAVDGIGLHYESITEDVTVPVGVVHDVTFETRVISAPEVMPGFYVPGEVIYYDVVIENKSNTALTYAAVDFSLLPGANVLSADRIEAGETIVCGPYSYQVTFDDAVGPLVNLSQLAFTYEDTQTSDVKSSSVEVWIGLNDGSLEITKSIANAPANGSFFTEGETIEYVITCTNATNEAMFDVVVTDMLTSGSGYSETILSSSPAWAKGVCANTGFSHTVTAADVALGSVTNSARIHAVNNIGLHWETESDPVTALTGIAEVSADPAKPADPSAAEVSTASDDHAESSDASEAGSKDPENPACATAANGAPLWLTVEGTPVDGPVSRSEYATSASLYQAQVSGTASCEMTLSAASDAELGNQIIYIADLEDSGIFSAIGSLFNFEADPSQNTVRFGPQNAQESYRIAALMRMNVSDEPFSLTNMTDLTNPAVYKVYQTALSMASVRLQNVEVAYGDEMLTLVVWDQAHNGQCLVIIATHE